VKLQLYARAGIPEYWVASADDEWLEIYRSPDGDGYRESRRLQGDTTIAPLAFPDVIITVAEIFA